jgi:HAD superfamily hydrolase (TIGR01490 family)
MISAFFDVDGTLYGGRVWAGLMEYWKTHGRGLDARLFHTAFMPLYIARKLKLVSEERFRGPWAQYLAWPMRGWTQAQAQTCFDWVAGEYLKPLRHENVISRLHEHQSQGHVVVLVSSGLSPLLAAIGKTLDVEHAVGPQVEWRDGRLTGYTLPPLVIGERKASVTRQCLKEWGLEVDLRASFAYADSISDLPLLEFVGHPTVVNPDEQLTAMAHEHNWPILMAGH